MKILIATRNKDKFKLISNILSKLLDSKIDFYALSDIKEQIIDVEESGDVINRAYVKAFNVYNNLNNNIYDLVIGIDDVLEFNNQIVENVKDYITDILEDKLLKDNDLINVVRAYTFINKNGKYINILTKIPYKYMKLDHKIEIKENTYPLSNVMKYIDDNVINSDEYVLKYSYDKLLTIKKLEII